MEIEVILPKAALTMRNDIKRWIVHIVIASKLGEKTQKIPKRLPRIILGISSLWGSNACQNCITAKPLAAVCTNKRPQNNSTLAHTDLQTCRFWGKKTYNQADAEASLESNGMNPMGDNHGDFVNISAASIRIFAKDLLKLQEEGKEETDVSYWGSFFSKCYDCILKEKSTEDKGVSIFTVKETLFQIDIFLFGKKLIVAQNRELSKKCSPMGPSPYAL